MKNKKTATASTNSTLGGTSTDSTAPAASTTPGRAARAAAKSGKREYTARGTTYWARRVVLAGGKPVGRGKPAKEGRGQRMVVYIPVGMDYDAAVHGPGVKYNTANHRATHKRIRKDSVSYTFDDGVTPTKTKATKAKSKDKSKDKGRGKATKAKAKVKTAPSVPVAAVDTAAPVENSVPVAAPVENAAPVAAPATA